MILDEQGHSFVSGNDAQKKGGGTLPKPIPAYSAPPPSWRKPVGVLTMLALLTLWLWAVVTFAGPVLGLAWPLQLIFFLTMGIVWIAPLKPLLRWMEVGKWRE